MIMMGLINIVTVLVLSSLSVLSALAQPTGISQSNSTDAPEVRLPYAVYRGTYLSPASHNATGPGSSNSSVEAFLGVPYAQPPLDNLRFKKPQRLHKAASSRQEPEDVSQYPPTCIQGTTGNHDSGGSGSEDCLKLDIWRSKNTTSSSKLPVLFYIHGGGYRYGNPRNWPFDSWVAEFPDSFIAISIYYRLDFFGFLSGPGFPNAHADVNVGLWDQIEALRWTKQYIHYFGGNPDEITIMGQSAGGASVELLLLASHALGESLFRAAIPQSIWRVPVRHPKELQPQFDSFVNATSCPPTSEGVNATLECIVKADLPTLVEASHEVYYSNKSWLWTPVVDGVLIKDHPTALFKAKKMAKVPVLVGSTSNESLAYATDTNKTLSATYPKLTSTDLAQYATEFPAPPFDANNGTTTAGPEIIRTINAYGMTILRCGRELVAGAYKNSPKSYAYRFNQANPSNGTAVTLLQGVSHSADNYWGFDGINTGYNGTGIFTPLDKAGAAFASQIRAYYVSFVRKLDPNAYKLKGSPTWPEYSKGKRIVLQIPNNSSNEIGSYVENEPQKELDGCDFVFSKSTVEEN